MSRLSDRGVGRSPSRELAPRRHLSFRQQGMRRELLGKLRLYGAGILNGEPEGPVSALRNEYRVDGCTKNLAVRAGDLHATDQEWFWFVAKEGGGEY